MGQVIITTEHQDILPFWRRMPLFFGFPLHSGPLVYGAVLAAFSVLVPVLGEFLPPPLALIVVEAGIWLAALRYAFRVLEQTSLGYLTPDEYPQSFEPADTSLPYKMLGVSFVWGGITAAVAHLSVGLGWLLNLFTTLALPASIMALATTHSFGQGLNPGQWLRIMGGIGKPYLILCFFLFLLLGGGGIALAVLGPVLPSWALLPMANFAFVYFNLVMFNMMGYCLYQYHQALGLEVEVDPARAQTPRAGLGRGRVPSDPIDVEIAQHLASGDTNRAFDLAYEQQRLAPDDLSAQERYHKLLLLLPEKKDTLLAHGQRYITQLLGKGLAERALDIFLNCRAAQPDFASAQAEQVLLLAQAARRRRDYRLALELMRSFDKRHPQHRDVPGVYLLSAQILAENFKKDDLACAILQGLQRKFPEHPLAAEAGLYIKTLERMAKLG